MVQYPVSTIFNPDPVFIASDDVTGQIVNTYYSTILPAVPGVRYLIESMTNSGHLEYANDSYSVLLTQNGVEMEVFKYLASGQVTFNVEGGSGMGLSLLTDPNTQIRLKMVLVAGVGVCTCTCILRYKQVVEVGAPELLIPKEGGVIVGYI